MFFGPLPEEKNAQTSENPAAVSSFSNNLKHSVNYISDNDPAHRQSHTAHLSQYQNPGRYIQPNQNKAASQPDPSHPFASIFDFLKSNSEIINSKYQQTKQIVQNTDESSKISEQNSKQSYTYEPQSTQAMTSMHNDKDLSPNDFEYEQAPTRMSALNRFFTKVRCIKKDNKTKRYMMKHIQVNGAKTKNELDVLEHLMSLKEQCHFVARLICYDKEPIEHVFEKNGQIFKYHRVVMELLDGQILDYMLGDLKHETNMETREKCHKST
uniref:Protein kinase domain-containing protein n=1 Tax=Ditylenchus dipsaci TaxID=166011 RepID=A0A915EQI9_9BILA